ncbi:hypothetical protein CTA2_12640 [Colletotrichum tanaceti]|uniref:Uncharacterized protein n=1 Tax=Colletotrichum tanaceti TaxID=1306861 RepID=A0A4U6XRQ6_9PEZI|nr:hypothetical protein CTA2_12640 [Colletotrichum tanaceti]TKW58399.1 hypothetical protein CTA1_5242 [Colletotrichum tanaceti]
MEMIVDMYEEITRAMPRFQEYMEHFPQRKGLQDALLRIYCAYLDFAVSAVKFFSRSAYGKQSPSLCCPTA